MSTHPAVKYLRAALSLLSGEEPDEAEAIELIGKAADLISAEAKASDRQEKFPFNKAGN